MLFSFIFLIAIKCSYGIIYNLNDTEYDRLPPVFKLDQFDSCLRHPGDLYCHVDAELYSDEPNELLDIIKEYSERTMTHYNHSLIHWGVCVTKTCKEHLNRTAELHRALEGCLNESLHRDYRLQARLHRDRVHCTGHNDPIILTPGHYVVAVLLLSIILLTVLGSIYDSWLVTEKNALGLLLCFSLRRNWKRLVMPAGEGPEPRLRNLVFFNGIKTMIIIGVIIAHSNFPVMTAATDTRFMENFPKSMINHIYLNATLFVQLFFVMSGFLLAYNILIMEEKKKMSYSSLPLGILLRWLRLTPPYAVVLAFAATWWKYTSNGPTWHTLVDAEADDCRDYWYQNLFYIQTYFDYQQCMPHAWYLAADMQHSIIGLMIFTLASSPRARKVAIGTAFVFGLIAPAAHTYIQDLSPLLVRSPENGRQIFFTDPTFTHLYKRAHTNILNYATGIIVAMLVYRLQQYNYDGLKLQKYKILYNAVIPIMALLCMSGGVFYLEGWQASPMVRALYASGIRLAMGVIFSFGVICVIFHMQGVLRSYLEWRGWAALSRVSYCAYLVHFLLIKSYVGSATALITVSMSRNFFTAISFVVTSYIAATILYLLVESPFSQVVKKLTNAPRRTNEKNKSVSFVPQVVVLEKETAHVKL